MKMSASCTAPIQPSSNAQERAHPRYPEYRNYVAALSRQLVGAMAFGPWLDSKERFEQGHEGAFFAKPGAMLTSGWYKHVFHPYEDQPERFGPFATKEQADNA